MKVVESKTQDWYLGQEGEFITPEGYKFSTPDVKRKLCKFNSIPETLVGVDEKFGTTVTLDVLKKAAKHPGQFLVDDNGAVLSVIDPRNKFMPDQKYEEVVSVFETLGLTDHEEKKCSGVSRRTVFTLNEKKGDKFVDDIFHRQIIFERKDDGGVYLGLGLLRLVCTNGMLAAENQFKKIIRSSKVDEDLCKYFVSSLEDFSASRYLRELFFDGDRPYMASVKNYFEMADALKKVTDEDIASLYFPKEPIIEHYANQNVDVNTTPRQILAHLPSGLEYYKCFNILTNGVKKAENLRLEDEIAIGKFASSQQLRFVKAEDVHYHGMPTFNDQLVSRLMGDVA